VPKPIANPPHSIVVSLGAKLSLDPNWTDFYDFSPNDIGGTSF